MMPFPGEHSAMIEDPSQFEKFRRDDDRFDDGVDAVFGMTAKGKAVLQSIRMDKSLFTAEEAEEWLEDHDYVVELIPAKASKKSGAIRPPFGSVAGKARMAGKLVPFIPDHNIYVEPFAGGAALFWKKGAKSSHVEVLADADGDIANAYRVLQSWTDDEQEWLLNQPWDTGRVNFDRALKCEPQNRAEWFWKFRAEQFCSWAGDRTTFGHKRKQGPWAGVRRLQAFKDRLNGVHIHHQDWLRTIKSYDSPSTFFFLDPPYPDVMSRQHSEKFFGSFDRISTLEIVKELKDIQGRFLLTISDTPQMREAFKAWHQHSLETQALQQGTETGGKVKKRTELIVTNYELSAVAEEDRQTKALTAQFDITYKSAAEQVVGGVVYEANHPDGHGDWASEETIRRAMYEFMESGQLICVDHDSGVSAAVLECFQAEKNTVKGDGILRKGAWWLTLRITDPATWDRIEKDALRGFSWEGLVVRERDVSPP